MASYPILSVICGPTASILTARFKLGLAHALGPFTICFYTRKDDGSRRVRKSVIESCFGISQFLVLLGDMICPCVIPRWRVVTEGTNPGLNPIRWEY
jgi:hypothetical protein